MLFWVNLQPYRTIIMAFFKQSDLVYSYYWKTLESDPRLQGDPDASPFNRRDGREVLYLSRLFGEKTRRQSLADYHKLERLIRQHLPQSLHSQKQAWDWLIMNWSRY